MRSLFASESDRAKTMATTYQNKLKFDFSPSTSNTFPFQNTFNKGFGYGFAQNKRYVF